MGGLGHVQKVPKSCAPNEVWGLHCALAGTGSLANGVWYDASERIPGVPLGNMLV